MALPAPTPLTPTVRYMVAGVRSFSWVPTIAVKTAPTLAELSAGTDLTGQVASMAGFDVSTNMLSAPDAGSRFEAQVPGRIQSSASTINFYASKTAGGVDVRSLLTQDLLGFVVIYDEGIVTSGKCRVFPVQIASVTPVPDLEAVAQIVVTFAITSQPAVGVTIPSA
jgi:hypothetical protein